MIMRRTRHENVGKGRRESKQALRFFREMAPSARHALVKALPKFPKRGITKPLGAGSTKVEALRRIGRIRRRQELGK